MKNDVIFNPAKKPETVHTLTDELNAALSPNTLVVLQKELSRKNEDVHDLVVRMATLYLRTNETHRMETLLTSLASGDQLSVLFNRTWKNFIELDLDQEDAILNKVFKLQQGKARSTYLHSFVEGGNYASLDIIANSIRSAIINHEISPNIDTLCGIMLATLRNIPADLKSLRQEILHRETAKRNLEVANDEEGAEQSHHDLTPSNTVEFIPRLKSVYEPNAPIVRRPIPIERAHKLVRDALGPIWELLKQSAGKLSGTQMVMLLRAFNRATLVTPTLYLVPYIKDAKNIRIGDLSAKAFTYALATLNDDVRYEEGYDIYRKYLASDEPNLVLHKWASQSKSLIEQTLHTVSRASLATRSEKEALFKLARKVPHISGAPLAGYCYAMSRDASVTSTELFELFQKTRKASKWLKRHNLRFLNELFFGLSARGAFQLAHEVLSEMWQNDATISANAVRNFLERCAQSHQPELVEDILALMRPENPVTSYSDTKFGRNSATTTRSLPARLRVSPLSYGAIFQLDMQRNDIKRFSQHLNDFQNIDEHRLDRSLFQSLLSLAAKYANADFIDPIVNAFKSAGIALKVDEANAVCHVYNKMRKSSDAIEYIKSFAERGLTPNEATFANLAFAYAQFYNPDAALDVLNEMEAAGIAPTSYIFEALISILAPGSVERAEWILQHMDNYGVKPTLRVYEPLLLSYATSGNAEMFFHHAVPLIDAHRTMLPVEFCHTLIVSIGRLGDFSALQAWILPELQREELSKNFLLYGQLVLVYYRINRDDLVEETLKALNERSQMRNLAYAGTLVFKPALRYLAVTDLSRCWNLLNIMQNTCTVPLGHDLLASIIETVAQLPDPAPQAEALEWMRTHLHPMEYKSLIKIVEENKENNSTNE